MSSDPREDAVARRMMEFYSGDPEVRAAMAVESVSAEIRRPGLHLAEVVETVMSSYAERPALGRRAFENTVDPVTGRCAAHLLPRFDTITYGELWERVRAIAGAWHHDPEIALVPGDFVAIVGFTSSDYVALDLACVYLGAVVAPLPATAGAEELRGYLAEIEPRILAVTPDLLETAVAAIGDGLSKSVRLIVFDRCPGDDAERERIDSAASMLDNGTTLDTLEDVVERGARYPVPAMFSHSDSDDPLALLIYTSGSTGSPQGALDPERLCLRAWLVGPGAGAAITVNYMPLSHIGGRMTLFGVLARGGTNYFTAASDLSQIFDDIALVRPTELTLVPRLCDMALQTYHNELNRRSAEETDVSRLEAEVRENLRDKFFGGRLLIAGFGSAPLAGQMRTFIESVLEVPLRDGYGSTEAGGGIVLDNQVQRPPVIDYMLADVPELGYFSTDRPYPRGELLVKSSTQIPGYFKRPDLSATMIDSDGYYHTGDVMAQIGPDRLTYIDRRSNVVKLSQGEFVTIARVEAVLATARWVRQIFVYGSSERAYLLAVVVPTGSALREYCDPAELKEAVAKSLRTAAAVADLRPYEIPRDVLIETEPFAVANALLSGLGKLLRPELVRRYGASLQQMYADLEHAERQALRSIQAQVRFRPVREIVGRVASALLGSPAATLRGDVRFVEMGGDSLTAVALSKQLGELYGVDVPVALVIDPTIDLDRLSDYIQRQRSSNDMHGPRFESVHGSLADVRAADLVLDQFIAPAALGAAVSAAPPTAAPHVVLLTGATGFLGRFLCLEWLSRLQRDGGTLICLVRGDDAEHARVRLESAFESTPLLAEQFRKLSVDRLEVVAGDVTARELGLPPRIWDELACRVDSVVHAAALVNHVLPYEDLFGPNTVGTAELIRFAITSRRKRFSYVSTVGVAAVAGSTVFHEDSDVRQWNPAPDDRANYATGYSTSKWAGEVLLRDAHDRYGLPVTVFRSAMILAHRHYPGQVNVSDRLTRLLHGVLTTGLAPATFYSTRPGSVRAHYDGLPVDFVAEAMATLAQNAQGDFRTYHVVNPHDDGVDLDSFVDWMIDAGFRITRIDDYAVWVERVAVVLSGLSGEHRQNSLLPLLDSYRNPETPVAGSALPATAFVAGVRAQRIGDHGEIPRITPDLILEYADDLRRRALL